MWRTDCQQSFKSFHQSSSEIGPNKAVDEEVGGRVEHDQVPDDAVRQPPLGGDVVRAPSPVAFKDVRDSCNLIQGEYHLRDAEDDEDCHYCHHDLGHGDIILGVHRHSLGPDKYAVVEDG